LGYEKMRDSSTTGMLALAMEGLDLLKEGKWLNDKQLAEQRQAIQGLYG